MRPLRDWASVGGVKLLGACTGPPHLSDEPLQAVAPLDLRCHSRGETLKDEFETDDESAGSTPPTAKPKQKVKCPVNCDCDVSVCCALYLLSSKFQRETLYFYNHDSKKVGTLCKT